MLFILILILRMLCLLIIKFININQSICESFNSCNWRLIGRHQVLISCSARLIMMSEEMPCVVFLILYSYSCSLNCTDFLKSTFGSINKTYRMHIFMMVHRPVQIQCIVLVHLTHLWISHILIYIIHFFLFLIFCKIRVNDVSPSTYRDHAFIIFVKSWYVLIMWHIGCLDSIDCILNQRWIIDHISTYNTNVLLRCRAALTVYIN